MREKEQKLKNKSHTFIKTIKDVIASVSAPLPQLPIYTSVLFSLSLSLSPSLSLSHTHTEAVCHFLSLCNCLGVFPSHRTWLLREKGAHTRCKSMWKAIVLAEGANPGSSFKGRALVSVMFQPLPSEVVSCICCGFKLLLMPQKIHTCMMDSIFKTSLNGHVELLLKEQTLQDSLPYQYPPNSSSLSQSAYQFSLFSLMTLTFLISSMKNSVRIWILPLLPKLIHHPLSTQGRGVIL